MWDITLNEQQRHDFELDHFQPVWDKYSSDGKLNTAKRLKFVRSLMSLS